MTYSEPYSSLPDPRTQAAFYADVPFKRLIAFFLDVLIIFALTLGFVILTLGFGVLIFALAFAVIGFLYRVGTIAAGSATWGMRLMAIELRNLQGSKLSGSEALLHTIAFYISFGVFPVQIISAVLMLTTARGQGLTDMLFGTVALNRKANF